MVDPNVRRKDLPGDLRVFSEPLAEATSVSLGLWIRAGSATRWTRSQASPT